jgi:hypothetical protein
MANSRIGIKRALLAQAGTMATTPTGLVPVGVRKSSGLMITPLDEITDYRSRKLRNKINFKYEADSLQGRLRDFEWGLQFIQNGYDFQLLKERQNSNAKSGGCFNWASQINGLDFEYVMNNKERYLKWIFETAMEYDEAIALIDASDPSGTLTPAITTNAISGGNERGENFANYKYPWYFAIQAPSGTEIFSKKEIMERSFSLKTKGNKNEYNETVVNWITVNLTIKGSDATITKIVELLSKDQAPAIVVKEKLTSTLYEQFSFGANVLSYTPEFKLGDDEDYSQIVFEGDIAFDQFTAAYGAANGGVGDDTTVGTEALTEAEARQGGTLTIAA